MVMEGDGAGVLRLGAGHVPGTQMCIAAHRDTFFRALKDIHVNDTIRITTPEGTTEYRVVSTKIVPPSDTSVLDAKDDSTLTLVTCYPFYYIGPAPKRFIVQAQKN
jgi:sortase A